MKVKLIKGCAYRDDKVFVKASNPIIEVEESEGEKLIDSGYFKSVAGPEPVVEADDKEYIVKPVDFDKMTVSQLKDYAVENEIDLKNLTKKGDIIDCIIEAINNRTPEIFEN